MKLPPIHAVMMYAALMAAPSYLFAQPAPSAATNAMGPRMVFLTNDYHFGRVVAGTLVKHTFIVSNGGDQTLEISKVTPGCHCTTAGSWTHQIEPGKTGEIPLQFDSGVFRGDVTKNITVTSNDKLAPVQSIILRGTVWRPIDVTPQFAYINVPPDSLSNSTTVHITSQLDEPVTLSEPTSANGTFKAELKTLKPGKEFEVTVTAMPPFAPGNNTGTISIKTSMTNMPRIDITTIAMVQPAVGVTPMQITLMPQVDRALTNNVTITANGSKTLALSDPESSDKRISVALKEVQPGRVFQLAAVFPAGYQVSPDQQAQVTIKSNNPQNPVIVVPVNQMQRQPVMSAPLVRPRVMSQNPPPNQPPVHP